MRKPSCTSFAALASGLSLPTALVPPRLARAQDDFDNLLVGNLADAVLED